MAYKYVCTTCNTKTTQPEPYGDYDCSRGGCDGHLAYYVDMPMPDPVCQGLVHSSAVAEIRGKDKVLAGAVRMVFNRTATGRTAPGTTHVNHIHVGGNAQLNLLFDTFTYTVLGLVDGHMEKGMKQSVETQANAVTKRMGGPSTAMQIVGDTIK